MKEHHDNKYQNSILEHYQSVWNYTKPLVYLYDKGPIEALPRDFRVLEFPPNRKRDMWTYATCCMSQENDINSIEVHIFSSIQDVELVELLTALVYYHRITKNINLHHTVNFGRPWQKDSKCSYGFISLPYLDGPKLENLELLHNGKVVKFYWLIPITNQEVEYKRNFGTELLEQKFGKDFNYLNPFRKSVV